MSARAILSPKVNSLQFEDRVLLLYVPAKIGRSHKDDQVKSAELIVSLDPSLEVFAGGYQSELRSLFRLIQVMAFLTAKSYRARRQ